MAMVLPELFAKSNRITTVIIQKQLKTYNHLMKWKKNASVLEIGHGEGGNFLKSFYPYLPSDVKEYVATDISESMINYARKNSVLPWMEFGQLDIAAEQVPLEYLNRFDHIFGFFVMHMVRQPRQAFKNLLNILKEDGTIFLTFFKYIPFDVALDRLSKHPEWKQYNPENFMSPYYYSPSPREEWERDLVKAGFQVYELFEDSGIYEHVDENEYDNLFHSTCTIMPSIPENKRKRFWKIYLDSTKNGIYNYVQIRDDRKIFFTNYTMFVATARKI
nr:juvenile hormone acid O-methyltransferase-like isoform X1 [Leptinotarsa decemlineata]